MSLNTALIYENIIYTTLNTMQSIILNTKLIINNVIRLVYKVPTIKLLPIQNNNVMLQCFQRNPV